MGWEIPFFRRQFDFCQLFYIEAAPVIRRAAGLQSATTLASNLIAEGVRMPFRIPAQDVRTEQPPTVLVDGCNGLLCRDSGANKLVDLFVRLTAYRAWRSHEVLLSGALDIACLVLTGKRSLCRR